jgi:phosphoglycolate phosphatase
MPLPLIERLCNKTPRILLFDLDGTLVDSVPDIAWGVDAMLASMSRPKAGLEKVRQWVGNGAPMLVKRALANNHVPADIDDALYQQAFDLFLTHYEQANGRHSILYPGVAETLALLRETMPFMAIVTNKPIQFTQPLLEYLGLPQFDMVVGGDSLPECKPHPAPILHCLDKCQCSAEEALMVGDSVSDIKAAQAAGIPVVCVDYGYNQGINLQDYQPDSIISRFDSLVSPG